MYNTLRTDSLESRISSYLARGQYEAAQAMYDLAQSIGVPLRQEVIDEETAKRRQFFNLPR